MEELKEQLEAVRESGLANMLDRMAVSQVAEDMGFTELAELAAGDRDGYLALLTGR